MIGCQSSKYDMRYRELQAHHGFPWGMPCPNLGASVLKVRATNTKDKKHGGKTKSDHKKALCRAYQTSAGCPYGDRCYNIHQKTTQEAKNSE